MRRVVTLAALAAAMMVGSMQAQKMTQTSAGTGGSPHVKAEWTIDGAAIAIEYGRPFLKGRPEAQLMPPGKPWRTGADQPSLLTSDKPLQFGTVSLPAGTYTINTVPGATEWGLLFGKNQGQWGIPYKPELEVAKTTMTVGKTTAPVEQVTFSIDDTPAGATLRIEWGTTRATAPFTVGK